MKAIRKLPLVGLLVILGSVPLQAPAQTFQPITSSLRQQEFRRMGALHDRGSMEQDAVRRKMSLSKDEQREVNKIEAALAAKNYSGAAALIAAANAQAKTNDAKYTFAALQLRLGTETKNEVLQDQAIDAALAAGVAPAALLPELYRRQGVAAILAKDYGKAEGALTKLLTLAPKDADSIVLLAEAKNRANKPAEALPLLERAIAIKTAANQPVPSEWTRAVDVMKVKTRVKR